MTGYRPETIETLRFIATQDHVTNRAISSALRIGVEAAKRRVDNLHSQRFVESHGYTRGVPVKYSVTAKGLSFLRSIDRKPEPGNFPTPRQPARYEPLVVQPQEYVRPGSGDAYNLPSMDGGQTIKRKRPLIIGGAWQGKTV